MLASFIDPGSHLDRRYMVKHFLTRLYRRGRVFDIFETGASGWLLFQPILGHMNGIGGFAADLQFPVKKSDLKKEISRLIPRV